jgi:transcriptional regulator with XRE-family HTH domain
MGKAKSGLADVLRQAIKQSGLTLYAVAKTAGVDAPIVRRFMAGERDLRLATAAKLCEALNLKLVKLN